MVEARRVQGSVLKHMVEAINEMSVNCAISFGVNLNHMAKILRSAAKDDTITIKADYGAHFAIFIIESPCTYNTFVFLLSLVSLRFMHFPFLDE